MKIRTLAILSGLSTLACEGSRAPIDQQETAIESTSAFATASGPLKDTLALTQASKIRDAFRAGKQGTLSFGVYDLTDVAPVLPGVVSTRAKALGMAATEDAAVDNHWRGSTAGSIRIAKNENSGAEFFADTARFHRGAGVTRDRLLPDATYVTKARAYADTTFGAQGKQSGLYPYKVRKYFNANAPAGGMPQNEAVYQVAVAFNSSIDGLPIIGPGSKVVVHMTPAGEVVAHEAGLRGIKARRATVAGSSGIIAPDQAKAVAEARVKARGIDLKDYTLTREEFGYFRRGRNSVQRLLAPYYAYIYEPASSAVVGKKIVEDVPALTDATLLAAVRADEALDDRRKADAVSGLPAPLVK